MSVHISLPGETGVTAGVRFDAGAALVDSLSPNARAYLELAGAEITDDVEVVQGTPLEDLSAAQLRAAARDSGVEVPARATKPEIIAALASADLPVLSNSSEG